VTGSPKAYGHVGEVTGADFVPVGERVATRHAAENGQPWERVQTSPASVQAHWADFGPAVGSIRSRVPRGPVSSWTGADILGDEALRWGQLDRLSHRLWAWAALGASGVWGRGVGRFDHRVISARDRNRRAGIRLS
jgi:hypothetical protein